MRVRSTEEPSLCVRRPPRALVEFARSLNASGLLQPCRSPSLFAALLVAAIWRRDSVCAWVPKVCRLYCVPICPFLAWRVKCYHWLEESERCGARHSAAPLRVAIADRCYILVFSWAA